MCLMKKPETAKCELIELSPEKAEEFLRFAHPNRTISKNLVDRYAREMAADNWRVNGETIVISNHGRVLDGQHRLQSIVNSGVSIWTFLVTGIEESSMNTFDTGRARSAADILNMTGHANAKVLAPLLLLLWQHERLKPGAWLHGSASPIELDAVHAKYPQAGRSIEFCLQVKDVCSPALVAFAHLLGLTYGNDPDKTNEFVDKLASGADLSGDAPILVLRNQLLQTAVTTGRSHHRRAPVPRLMQLAWIVRAYNHHIAGAKVRVIRVDRSRDFPQIIGRPEVTPDDLFVTQPAASGNVQ
jgi:hypothetical protein